MLSLAILVLISTVYLFISYQAFVYHRTYWLWPTVAGFKKRKENVSSGGYSFFVGVLSLAIGVFFLYLFFASLL